MHQPVVFGLRPPLTTVSRAAAGRRAVFSCGCPSSLPLGTRGEWNGGWWGGPASRVLSQRPSCFLCWTPWQSCSKSLCTPVEAQPCGLVPVPAECRLLHRPRTAPSRVQLRELGGSFLFPELQAVKVQWGAGQVLPGSSDPGLRLQLVGGGGKGAGSSFSREGSESMSGPNVPWEMGELRLRENGMPLRLQTSLKPWRELLPPTISQPWLPWARRGRTGAGGSI